jgi:hypothetical protein
MPPNAGNAGPVDQSPVSENQDKTVDMYFGVFIDVREIDHWINAAGNYRNKGKKWKEGLENDVQDSSYYKYGMMVEGTARNVADKLPNNPVSNAIKKGLDAKDKVIGYMDKAEGALGKIEGAIDGASDKALNNDFVQMDGIDPLGSNRSIISMMEPAYCGGIFSGKDDAFFSEYNYRIYTQGSVFTGDFSEKKSTADDDLSESEEGISKDARQIWSDETAQEALNAITGKLDKAPKGTKLSVHFDIFGYAKDASIDILEPEINNIKGNYPDINEISIDYIGKYNHLNDPDEVQSDFSGDTYVRFRNHKFLEKHG